MKFGISNEGINLAFAVLDGTKTITRRDEPYKVGNIEPFYCWDFVNGNWLLIGHIKIISCENDPEWSMAHSSIKEYEEDAKKEGYSSWKNLWSDLKKFYAFKDGLPEIWRIGIKMV